MKNITPPSSCDVVTTFTLDKRNCTVLLDSKNSTAILQIEKNDASRSSAEKMATADLSAAMEHELRQKGYMLQMASGDQSEYVHEAIFFKPKSASQLTVARDFTDAAMEVNKQLRKDSDEKAGDQRDKKLITVDADELERLVREKAAEGMRRMSITGESMSPVIAREVVDALANKRGVGH